MKYCIPIFIVVLVSLSLLPASIIPVGEGMNKCLIAEARQPIDFEKDMESGFDGFNEEPNIKLLDVQYHVRKKGDGTWKKHIEAGSGDALEFRICIRHKGLIDDAITPAFSTSFSDNLRDIMNGKIDIKRENNNRPHPSFVESFFEYKYLERVPETGHFRVSYFLISKIPYDKYGDYLTETSRIADELREKFAELQEPLSKDAIMISAPKIGGFREDEYVIIDLVGGTPEFDPPEFKGYLLSPDPPESDISWPYWILIYKFKNIFPESLHYPWWYTRAFGDPRYDERFSLWPGDSIEITFEMIADCFKDGKLIDKIQINGEVVPEDRLPEWLPEHVNGGSILSVCAQVKDWWRWSDKGLVPYIDANVTVYITPPFDIDKKVKDPSLPEPDCWVESAMISVCNPVEYRCSIRCPTGLQFEKGLQLIDHLPENIDYIKTKHIEIKLLDKNGNIYGTKAPSYGVVSFDNGDIIWFIEEGIPVKVYTPTVKAKPRTIEIFSEITIIYEGIVTGSQVGPIVSALGDPNEFGLPRTFSFINYYVTPSPEVEVSAPPKYYTWSGGEILDKAYVIVGEGYYEGNHPPVARDDSIKIPIDAKRAIIPILDNDYDPNGKDDIAGVRIVKYPSHGELEEKDGNLILINGGVIYTPHPDYVGKDLFTYVVYDKHGAESNEATVEIIICRERDNRVALQILQPLNDSLYVLNNLLLRSFPLTLVIGRIDIVAKIGDPTNTITNVRFFVDDREIANLPYNPKQDLYNCTWNDRAFGLTTIRVVVYAGEKEFAREERKVFAFILGILD